METAASRRCDHCAHPVAPGAAFCAECGAVCPWNIPTEVHRAEEPESPAFVLVYLPGGTVRKESLRDGSWKVGRSDRCDIVVEHPKVSRHHATLRREDGSCWIEDARSSGGTFVNDRPVHAAVRLQPGDTCRLGRGPDPTPSLVYHEEGDGRVPAPPPPPRDDA